MNRLFAAILLLFALASCVPQRKTVYVQSTNETKSGLENWTGTKQRLKISPFDMLYVRVTSIDNPEYNFFNEENKINTSITDASLAVTSYTVDENGYILLPVIGKVKVSDYTLQEAAKVLQEHLKAVLSSPIVSIRFVNNSITVLGEVNNPGTYSYTSEQLNIFKAIGMAGDISEYGNRNEVILIRENGSEIQKRRIDLTKDQVFKSEYYYLRPNDVIYVSPLKIRRFGMKEVPYSLILSVGNTAMVVLVFYLNYINSR